MPADAFKELLERAFAAARDAGKPAWNRMILAVLRNRLLQLTNHGFNVSDFGAQSLLELVSRYRDLVAIDRTVKPVVIEWLGPITVAAPARACRVRPDLWRAALDLSSGLQYEWDAAAGYARAVGQADPTRRLPTVDAATLAAWRNAFVDEYGSTLSDPRDQERLRAWLATALGRQGLPGALRAQWSEYLKRAVVARLTSWFQDAGYSAPDLFGAPIDA
jgi:hypothetical protein